MGNSIEEIIIEILDNIVCELNISNEPNNYDYFTFQNEEQFRIELIKRLENETNKKYKIYVEIPLFCNNDNKKCVVDIIIKDSNNNKYFIVELKLKTILDIENNRIPTAYNSTSKARKLYLKDCERLKYFAALKNDEEEGYFISNNKGNNVKVKDSRFPKENCIGGVAIMLSNNINLFQEKSSDNFFNELKKIDPCVKKSKDVNKSDNKSVWQYLCVTIKKESNISSF